MLSRLRGAFIFEISNSTMGVSFDMYALKIDVLTHADGLLFPLPEGED